MGQSAGVTPYAGAMLSFSSLTVLGSSTTDFAMPLRLGVQLTPSAGLNIMAELPGWRRFPPAEQWLQRNIQVAAAPNLQDLRAIFARFIDERQQAAGGPTLSPEQKNELFGQFELWQKGQVR